MAEFMSFEIDTIEKLQVFKFDDPYDRRRYFEAGDNQIAADDGLLDGFVIWGDVAFKQYGDKIGYCGNNNIQIWETGDLELIKIDVLKKLNAAKQGGFNFQSDHSVSSAVSGQTYDYIVNLVREYGKYPLDLGEFNIEI